MVVAGEPQRDEGVTTAVAKVFRWNPLLVLWAAILGIPTVLALQSLVRTAVRAGRRRSSLERNDPQRNDPQRNDPHRTAGLRSPRPLGRPGRLLGPGRRIRGRRRPDGGAAETSTGAEPSSPAAITDLQPVFGSQVAAREDGSFGLDRWSLVDDGPSDASGPAMRVAYPPAR